jgi:hypothetical protein
MKAGFLFSQSHCFSASAVFSGWAKRTSPFPSIRTLSKVPKDKNALKSAKSFKYDHSEMKWVPKEASATTGAPSPLADARAIGNG